MTSKLNYTDSAIREGVINRKANAMTANYNLLLQRLERGLGLPDTDTSQQAARGRLVHERQSVFRKFQTDVDAFNENKENVVHNSKDSRGNLASPAEVVDLSENGDPDIFINHMPESNSDVPRERSSGKKYRDGQQRSILKRDPPVPLDDHKRPSPSTSQSAQTRDAVIEDITDIRDSGSVSYSSANAESKSVKFKMTKPHETDTKLISVDEAPPLKRDKYNLLPNQYHASVKETRINGPRQMRAVAAFRHKTRPSPPPPPPNSALERREHSSGNKLLHESCTSKEPTVLKREKGALNKSEEKFYDRYRFKVPNTDGGRTLTLDSGSADSSGSGLGNRSKTLPSMKMRRLGVINRTEKPVTRDSVPVGGVGAVYKIHEYNKNMWKSSGSPASLNNHTPRSAFRIYNKTWDARSASQNQTRNVQLLNTSLKSENQRKTSASSSSSSLPTIRHRPT